MTRIVVLNSKKNNKRFSYHLVEYILKIMEYFPLSATFASLLSSLMNKKSYNYAQTLSINGARTIFKFSVDFHLLLQICL